MFKVEICSHFSPSHLSDVLHMTHHSQRQDQNSQINDEVDGGRYNKDLEGVHTLISQLIDRAPSVLDMFPTSEELREREGERPTDCEANQRPIRDIKRGSF